MNFDILSVSLDPVAADDLVDAVERSIRTVKNDCRTLTHGFSFKRMPRIMVSELVFFAIKYRNFFPSPNGVSSALLPSLQVRISRILTTSSWSLGRLYKFSMCHRPHLDW